jgi:hypothetical protein
MLVWGEQGQCSVVMPFHLRTINLMVTIVLALQGGWCIDPRTVEATVETLHNRGQVEVLLPYMDRAKSLRLAIHDAHDREPPHNVTMRRSTHDIEETSQPYEVPREQPQHDHAITSAHFHTLLPLPINSQAQMATQYTLEVAANRLLTPPCNWEITLPQSLMAILPSLHDMGLLDVWKPLDQCADQTAP